MRVLLNRVRQSLSARLWAWPLLLGVAGAIAAVVLGAVSVPQEAFLARFLWPGDTSAAASMLGFIASTTLTVLTTTISMTLIVLQVASGHFSHQLSRDFISSRAVRGIVSVYVGVFTYTVLLLRSLDSKDDRPPQLAMTVAMLLIFGAVATFVWYVSRVVDMVRVDSVINDSARRILDRANTGDEDAQAADRPTPPQDAVPIIAGAFGYVQGVDIAHAASWAREHAARVVIDVRPGDAVVIGQQLGVHWGAGLDDDGHAPSFPEVVYLATERVSGQDYSLGLRQLLDIGVRALSSGVNDPTTAEHVVWQATSVLRELARRPPLPQVRHDEDDQVIAWAAVRTTAQLVQAFVGGMRRYASAEPEVLIALLRLLDVVEDACETDVLDVTIAERARLVAAAERGIAEPYDLARVLDAAHTDADHAPTSGV